MIFVDSSESHNIILFQNNKRYNHCNIYKTKARNCIRAIPYFSHLVLRLGIEPRSKV